MQYVTGIHAKSVYTCLSWQNLLASIPCNSRGIFHSIDHSVYRPVLDLGMQCSPLQLIPLSWIVCFLILALIGHLCASQDNLLSHYSTAIRDEIVRILHRSTESHYERGLATKKLLNLLLEVHWVCNNFIVPCKCATWERLIYNRRLDSDPVAHIIILPLVKAIPQAIPLFLLPLFPSVAMKRILLGIQNPQGKFCAQKPLARHTRLPRAQHKHYNTGAPGTPKTSPISPQMHQASFCKSNILTESW